MYPVTMITLSFILSLGYLAPSSNGICVSTFIFGCLPVPRGKHPNMNVETQIPLELLGSIILYSNNY